MGLVQQEWVGQSRGKMPLPRFYWQPWERHLAAIPSTIAPARRSHAALRFKSVPLALGAAFLAVMAKGWSRSVALQ